VLEIARTVNGHPRDALNLLAMWAAAIEGGTAPEDVPRLMKTVEAVQPYVAIQQYCKGILTGKLKLAFKALQHCGHHEYFVGQTLELLREVLYRWMSHEHFSRPQYDRDMQAIDPPGTGNIRALGRALEILLDAQDRIKQYRCDNQAVLESATIEVVALLQKVSG